MWLSCLPIYIWLIPMLEAFLVLAFLSFFFYSTIPRQLTIDSRVCYSQLTTNGRIVNPTRVRIRFKCINQLLMIVLLTQLGFGLGLRYFEDYASICVPCYGD